MVYLHADYYGPVLGGMVLPLLGDYTGSVCDNFSPLVHSLRNLKRITVLAGVMAGPVWKNVYRLSDEQISKLDEAEDKMEMMDITGAEAILLGLLEGDGKCVPVLNNLAHMNGRYLSDFEKAIEYYERVLEIEPDNAWARDERRRYQRYLTYD